MSGDLRHVKIFVSVLGDDEAKARTMEALTRATGYIRTEIGQRIRLRHTPEIHIKPDESIARGARIFELLREVGSAETKETGAEANASADASSSKPSLPGDRFLIACHVDPDPDCIGSLLALDWLLERLGKRSQPLSHDGILPQWRFLPRIERIASPREPAAWSEETWDALWWSTAGVERTGSAAAWADRVERVINIDHHVTNPGTGHINLVLPDAAAAGASSTG